MDHVLFISVVLILDKEDPGSEIDNVIVCTGHMSVKIVET